MGMAKAAELNGYPGPAHVLTLAKELAPHVRVNAIMPGVIATAHHETFSTPAKMEDYKKQTPLARNGTADEVAQTVVWLSSDASSFITGAILPIDGGKLAGTPAFSVTGAGTTAPGQSPKGAAA